MIPELLLTCIGIETKNNKFQNALTYKNYLKLKVKQNHTTPYQFRFHYLYNVFKFFFFFYITFCYKSILFNSL